MSDVAATENRETQLTEEIAERGMIGVQVGDHLVAISGVEHWVEDGLHVFRSVEFDCMAEGADLSEAVVAFVENAEDLFRSMDNLVDAGRATEDEKTTLIKLSRRFFELYEASELEQEKQSNHRVRHLLRLLRQSPRSRPEWQRQQPAPANYSRLSHA